MDILAQMFWVVKRKKELQHRNLVHQERMEIEIECEGIEGMLEEGLAVEGKYGINSV